MISVTLICIRNDGNEGKGGTLQLDAKMQRINALRGIVDYVTLLGFGLSCFFAVLAIQDFEFGASP